MGAFSLFSKTSEGRRLSPWPASQKRKRRKRRQYATPPWPTPTPPPDDGAETEMPFRLFSSSHPPPPPLPEGNSTETEMPFRLFSSHAHRALPCPPPPPPPSSPPHAPSPDSDADTSPLGFADLGLSHWAAGTCRDLGMIRPTAVQRHCVPPILAGLSVLGVSETGSGKTAAYTLPILHRLAADPFGVFALVVAPARELASQIADHFRIHGSYINARCSLLIGGRDAVAQSRELSQRPHIVVATPGRIRDFMEKEELAQVFSNTKFLVLDEADRIFDVAFEDELKVIIQTLPRTRQTLFFSATMTCELQAMLESSATKPYVYRSYEGLKTVDSLKQKYMFFPYKLKVVHLVHVLERMKNDGVRSAIVFVSTCRTCHLLNLLLEELGVASVALHSLNSQPLRFAALKKFKSGAIPVLLSTDVASRGLDIPTVDLVINYDLPRYSREYVHRVGRTSRAGRGGLSICFVTQTNIKLLHSIEEEIGKKMDKFEYNEEILESITKVFKATRVVTMKMLDDGFDEKAKVRKAQKLKNLEEKSTF